MKKVCSGGKVKFCCGLASTGPSRQSDILVPSSRENEKSMLWREGQILLRLSFYRTFPPERCFGTFQQGK
jgi:hypothetical protein